MDYPSDSFVYTFVIFVVNIFKCGGPDKFPIPSEQEKIKLVFGKYFQSDQDKNQAA
jgi:hypothetical protein